MLTMISYMKSKTPFDSSNNLLIRKANDLQNNWLQKLITSLEKLGYFKEDLKEVGQAKIENVFCNKQ